MEIKIEELKLILKNDFSMVWTFDDNFIIVTKSEHFPDECKECGYLDELSSFYGVKFQISYKGIFSEMTIQYKQNEDKRDEYFNKIDREIISEMIKKITSIIDSKENE